VKFEGGLLPVLQAVDSAHKWLKIVLTVVVVVLVVVVVVVALEDTAVYLV